MKIYSEVDTNKRLPLKAKLPLRNFCGNENANLRAFCIVPM